MSQDTAVPRTPRRRTRLRSGKVADRDGRFIVECQILNRSDSGARLRLVQPADVPDEGLLFDDEFASARPIEVIWRQQREIGVKFGPPPHDAATAEVGEANLSGKFYALTRRARD